MSWPGQLRLDLQERDTVCLQECAGARSKASATGGIPALQSVGDIEWPGARRSGHVSDCGRCAPTGTSAILSDGSRGMPVCTIPWIHITAPVIKSSTGRGAVAIVAMLCVV